MKITFLGTNGWYDTSLGHTLCILVETSQYNIILDAGSGFPMLDQYLTNSKPAYLFLSHFHIDHIVGLHTLFKFDFPHGLNIVGQSGTREALEIFVAPPFSAPINMCSFPIAIYEIPRDQYVLPFPVIALPLVHATSCYGYKFEIDRKILAYCTDTGYCENAVSLARGADLLITECARKAGQPDGGWPHLNPPTAARIAREAGARRLALVHFEARTYTQAQDRQDAENEARQIFPNVFAARDEMQIEI